jgi:hypothetical protein
LKLIAASLSSAAGVLLLRILLLSMCFITAADCLAKNDEPRPSAERLMRDVVAQLPTEPMTVSGKLVVRRRHGMPVAIYPFELKADWGAHPASATYRINDSFGQSLEQLKIIHGKDNQFIYSAGDPLKLQKIFNLSSRIQKTDLSWTDLTLSFLWWKDGKIVGEESIRTYNCYIVEVNAPSTGRYPYASVKLWISKKAHFMLQAEGYNDKHKIMRRLWIKTVQKINDDEWMIKDMEIQRYPKAQMTKLRVISVKKTEPEIVNIKKKAAPARTEP